MSNSQRKNLSDVLILSAKPTFLQATHPSVNRRHGVYEANSKLWVVVLIYWNEASCLTFNGVQNVNFNHQNLKDFFLETHIYNLKCVICKNIICISVSIISSKTSSIKYLSS